MKLNLNYTTQSGKKFSAYKGKQMKSKIIGIAAVLFMFSTIGWAQAADLRDVRTGKHEKFTRIVFEFKDSALFENPAIKGQGKFSVVFLDSSTTLPHLMLLKTGPVQLVQSIEFVPIKSNLVANVRLSFPYFILKSYPLSNPDRIVVDAYPVSSPPEKPEQKVSIRKKPLSQTQMLPEKKEPENAPKKDLGKAAGNKTVIPPAVEKSEIKKQEPPEEVLPDKMQNQIPVERVESPFPANPTAMTQIYLLAMLNVLTGVIIVLMIFTLLKKRNVIDVGRLFEIMEFIKTSDESIENIDAQLKTAFKEYDKS